MLSRTLRRALLEQPSRLPPTFLLPWTAGLSTITESQSIPPPPLSNSAASIASPQSTAQTIKSTSISATLSQPTTRLEISTPAPTTPTTPPNLSPSVRELLPLLRAQSPHYISAHIYGRPYLLTQGDTVRLPFDMPGVEPGDTLRLTRATNLGSRDFTLKAAAAAPRLKSVTQSGSTKGGLELGNVREAAVAEEGNAAPHFIPHIEKGKVSYLDERLFVCRATVVGVESEPMRFKEKTKRRQRHVRTIKSKHRFTVLRVKELRVRSLEEIESGEFE